MKSVLRLMPGMLSLLITTTMFCACARKQVELSEDITYLTPIPEDTLQAYKGDSSLETKIETSIIESVIEARLCLKASRLDYAEEPIVILADEMRLDDANRRFIQVLDGAEYHDDRPGNTKVWFVVFEGDMRIKPPAADTPEPFLHGCVYTLIDKTGDCRLVTVDCSEIDTTY